MARPRRHAACVQPGAGPAQRAARARARRRLARARSARGTWSWPATASRCATTAPARSAPCASRFAELAGELGLAGAVELRYRPRSRAESAQELAAELAERIDSDLERGFTTHGPHRDDVALLRDGRELRAYGSQGEQRLGLLALLLAEREVLADAARRARRCCSSTTS